MAPCRTPVRRERQRRGLRARWPGLTPAQYAEDLGCGRDVWHALRQADLEGACAVCAHRHRCGAWSAPTCACLGIAPIRGMRDARRPWPWVWTAAHRTTEPTCWARRARPCCCAWATARRAMAPARRWRSPRWACAAQPRRHRRAGSRHVGRLRGLRHGGAVGLRAGHDPVAALVRSAHQANVSSSVINGRVVVMRVDAAPAHGRPACRAGPAPPSCASAQPAERPRDSNAPRSGFA